MVFLYILQNKYKKHYIGITSLSPNERLRRHNKGDVRSTRLGRPWKLIYIERFDSVQETRKREKKIKSWKGGNAFKKFISKAAGSSNGRTVAFEAINLGSNPSPAALEKK